MSCRKKRGWMYVNSASWEYLCADGVHNSFWKTVVTSPQWKAWKKKPGRKKFDVDECEECGWISPEHFKAFLEFCIGK